MSDKPNYYAIIPAAVRYDKELSPNAKLLYGEITALSSKTGECFPTNKYFADLYNLTQVSISRLIKQLEKNGYIKTKTTYKEGIKEIDKRYIQICKEGINKNDNFPLNKNVKGNNTSNINNTSINKTSYNPPKAECKEKIKKYYESEELNKIFIEFLELRKNIKAVNSDRAIKTLLNKLDKYDDSTKIKMLEKSIVNSWKDVYQLKPEEIPKPKSERHYFN